MNIEKMQEEFEGWLIKVNRSCASKRNDAGGYNHYGTQACWAAWQASRESLVIELSADDPLSKGPGDCEGGLPSFEQHCAAECNAILADCREAIHAVGVRAE